MATTFNHVGLTVRDIRESADFYAQLGFTPEEPATNEFATEWIRTMTGFVDAHILTAHMSLDNVTLELLQYLAPDGAPKTRLKTCDAGSAHIAVQVDSIETLYDQLLKAGVFFLSPPITIPEGLPFAGVKAVYATDPDGNTVEFIEWADTGDTPERS